MARRPRLLVLEGNTREKCEEAAAHGAMSGGVLYAHVIDKIFPAAQCDIVHPAEADSGMPAGAALTDYDGAVMGGSGLLISIDSSPPVIRQVDLARAIMEAGVPFFGSCWALQVAVAAAGGGVKSSPRGRELGIARKIALTAAGQAHSLYEGKSRVFDSIAIHFDEITHLPPGAEVLATNNHSRVQALTLPYKGGHFTGVQYHPEYDLPQIARLIGRDAKHVVEMGFFAGEDAAKTYRDQLEALHRDPGRQDLAWLLGIDADILDEGIRYREILNWIKLTVLPYMARR